MIRLWLLVVILTLVSWAVVKLAQKKVHLGWIFLFWTAVIFGTTLLLYGLSLLVSAT